MSVSGSTVMVVVPVLVMWIRKVTVSLTTAVPRWVDERLADRQLWLGRERVSACRIGGDGRIVFIPGAGVDSICRRVAHAPVARKKRLIVLLAPEAIGPMLLQVTSPAVLPVGVTLADWKARQLAGKVSVTGTVTRVVGPGLLTMTSKRTVSDRGDTIGR